MFLLTGAVDSGKSSRCLSFVTVNPGYDGVLLLKVFEGGGRIGYDAVRITSGERVPFSRLSGREPPGWCTAERIGPFAVSEEGKRTANRWLIEARGAAERRAVRGLIIDEVGPLELRGGGLAPAVRIAVAARSGWRLVLVVRRRLLEGVIESFSVSRYRLIAL